MKLISLCIWILTTSCCYAAPLAYEADWGSLSRHESEPEWFKDAKLGIYFHWGPYSVPAFVNEWYPRHMFQKGSRENRYHIKTYGDPSEYGYDYLVERWKTPNFDATEWAALFRRAGARFAGPVAEHHDGFSLWESEVTPWNAVDKGPGRDLVGELAQAVRGEGLRYITTLHHARNHYGHYGELRKHYPEVFENEDTAKLYGNMSGDAFHDMWLAKLKEIIDRYQPDIIWFDSWLDRIPEDYRERFAAYYLNAAEAWDREVVIVRKQNDLPLSLSVLDHEKTREGKISERAWMTDDTISTGSWCYTDALKIKPSYKVVHALIDTVSKNGVVLLNISPKADGTIPEDQRQVLHDLGGWLEVNGEAIYATRPWEVFGEGPTVEPHSAHRNHQEFLALEYGSSDIRYTRSKDGKTLYAIAMGWPQETLSFSALRVVDASPDATVELVGHPGALRHEVDEQGRLMIHVPDLPEGERPSRFAHSFKLLGFDLTPAG